jgi:hypothetical protein
MNRLSSRIKTREDYELFAKAVEHFNLEAKLLRTEKAFLPYWSSFVGTSEREPWRDYIDRPDESELVTGASKRTRETADEIADRLIAEHERKQGA